MEAEPNGALDLSAGSNARITLLFPHRERKHNFLLQQRPREREK
jgi:hypothetical protein